MQDVKPVPAARSNPFSALNAGLRTLGLSLPFLACVLILAILPIFIHEEYMLRLFVQSLYFGTLAMIFDFTGGFINFVNFGFAGFVGLGAYIAAMLSLYTTVNPWLGLIGAMLVTGLVGFLTGLLTVRLRGIYVSLMSWFVGMTLEALATAMIHVTRGARGIIVPPMYKSITVVSHLYILLGAMLILYVILHLIIRSKVGLAFRAIGQNYEVARASGVNPIKYKLINFTLSCACAGLIGGYYAHFIGIVTPELLDMSHTMEVMALSFIGGSGSLLGGVFAAFLFIPVFNSLESLMNYRLVIYGLSLILIMIFYPAGLNGLYQIVKSFLKSLKGKKPS
jgi:branched-chain amino acid transport system permease protein